MLVLARVNFLACFGRLVCVPKTYPYVRPQLVECARPHFSFFVFPNQVIYEHLERGAGTLFVEIWWLINR